MKFAVTYVALVLYCVTPTISAGWVDMDTPLDKRTTKSLIDGSVYHLVMSDEFNTPNRTFKDGHDPIWTALDKSDDDSSSAGGGSQQFYNSSFVTTTESGMLKISTKIGKTEWNRYDEVQKEWSHETSYFKSGMVQSWNKFCFTGGIVEVDIIFPGDPFIGGLWPAVWMLGNLGRATYEASTNNIWPWSYDTCDRDLQEAQAISACNAQNHFGLNPYQGRGATEIDLIEVMTGDSGGPLPSTDPPIALPYGDMTLQVAPGIPQNRPQSGSLPVRTDTVSKSGHTQFLAQSWYDNLEYHGNTSINPFFYGTYLGETKKGEPVTRTKNQAFQADAVGVAHQLTPSHFNRTHTFRIEWQPGPGGRIDWFTQGHKINSTFVMEGDGLGTDWLHAFGLKDKSISDLMGSQIPMEPSYLIMNTAISSNWGFPWDAPSWCQKCYDCDNPKCTCAFSAGFCNMLRHTDVAMLIDSVRVYQSRDPSAHVGANHTLGCDPPEFPTREFIKGHEYRYMRNPPFSYADKGPLRPVQRGGGDCNSDADCGGDRNNLNLTEVYESGVEQRRLNESSSEAKGRGVCVPHSMFNGLFSQNKGSRSFSDSVCQCHPGFTGPHCLAEIHTDDSPSAYQNHQLHVFDKVPNFWLSPFMAAIFAGLVLQLLGIFFVVMKNRRTRGDVPNGKKPEFQIINTGDLTVTGRSI